MNDKMPHIRINLLNNKIPVNRKQIKKEIKKSIEIKIYKNPHLRINLSGRKSSLIKKKHPLIRINRSDKNKREEINGIGKKIIKWFFS